MSGWVMLGIEAQEQCETEPWGRYSASGGRYQNYLYSFGGDTSSVADNRRGGVIRTNFRYDIDAGCWERITDSPVAVGYRATATLLNGDFYIFGGGDVNYQAVDHFWKLSLPDHTWSDITNATSSNRPTARYKHAAVKLSDTTMLIHGGRRGNVVLSDAWIFDAVSMGWTSLGETNVTAYRHGMAHDTDRSTVWIYGGLDGTISRNSDMYRFDLASSTMSAAIQYGGSSPGRRASHALEYLPELDALLLYGGTCSTEADLLLYNVSQNSWCSLSPERRPSRRDAMLWAFDFPMFYMYSGDVICVSIGDVYSIADVHALNITNYQSWELLYDPRNERAPNLMDLCDGTNNRMCRVPPLFPNFMAGVSTCASSSRMDSHADMSIVPVSATSDAPVPTPSSGTSHPGFAFSVVSLLTFLLGARVW